LDNQLVQLGWKINAKYNVTLKGWTVQYTHQSVNDESKALILSNTRGSAYASQLLQAVRSGMNIIPCTLAEAIRSLPSGSEKSERQRIKRNVIAYRRISPDLKQTESNPDGIKDPDMYNDGTGSLPTSLVQRFMEGSDETIYSRAQDDRELGFTEDDQGSHQTRDQALWWSELTDEQQAIVRDAQSTPKPKKRR
jgi:hypothetical protein